MCPDPQLLSVYLDGELPSPWKEKMETHLASCPKCKEKIEDYKKLHCSFNEEDLQKSKDRVWEKLENKIGTRRRFTPRNTMWRRRLSIPLPAAAAAAIVIMVITTLWLRDPVNTGIVQRTEAATESLSAENAGFTFVTEMERIDEIPGMIPTSNISEVLQYLTPNSGTNIIILQLPEMNFSRSGEPAMIRAADYSRR